MSQPILSHIKSRSLAAVALLLPAAMLLGCFDPKSQPVAETVRPALVANVRSGSAGQLAFVGEVRAAHRAELAFPVSGRVAAVLADVGDKVLAGQIVARLDEQPLRAQLVAAQAEVSRTQSLRVEARRRGARVETAQTAGATSAGEREASLAEIAAAEAAVQAAEAQRDLATWSLAQAVLRAPQAGVVAQRQLEPGQAAGPGAAVLTLDGAGRELVILVPGSLPLKVGQAVGLRSGDDRIESRVLRYSGRLEGGGVRRVYLAVPDKAAVGSTWSASIDAAQGDSAALQVPLRAVVPGTEVAQGHVLRIGKDGRTTEKVAVRLGALHGDWVEVIEGLRAEDRVVVAGAAAIRPGSAVKPVASRAEVKS